MNDVQLPIRPASVVWLSGLFIVSGILGFALMMALIFTPELMTSLGQVHAVPWMVYTVTGVSSLAYLVSGLAMLQRQNWGRHLLLWVSVPVLLVSAFLGLEWGSLLISVILLAAMVAPLYQPSVRRYFLGTQTAEDRAALSSKSTSSLPIWRKILAILAFMASGFFVYLLTVMSFINVYGAYDILLQASRGWFLGFVCAHGLGLWLYNSPARFLASGVTLFIATGFTALAIWIITSVPLPESLTGMDLQAQFSSLAVGWSFTGALAVIGVMQMVTFAVSQGRQSRPKHSQWGA